MMMMNELCLTSLLAYPSSERGTIIINMTYTQCPFSSYTVAATSVSILLSRRTPYSTIGDN